MRSIRWQLIALVFAVVLFGAALFTRFRSPTPTQQTSETPTDVASVVTPTQQSTATVTPLPLPTATPSTDETPSETPSTAALPTFREALIGDVQRLNPLMRGINPAEDAITSLIFEGLTTTNAFGEPRPALASEWVIASNRIEYVFKLREDILWHDGTPFTASDVAFTMDLLRSPNFPGDPNVAAFWRTVETQVLGDHLIRFRLTQPLSSFLDALRIGIVPEHALQGTTAATLLTHPFNLSPIGTGPYQIEAVRSTEDQVQVVDLRMSQNYRQRSGGQDGFAIERMRFQVYPNTEEAVADFNSGQVDGIVAPTSDTRPQLLSIPQASIHSELQSTLGVMIFNWRLPGEDEEPNPYREIRVRRALTLAIDREAIVQRNLTGLAATAHNPLMPGVWAYDPDIRIPTPDISEAQRLLENAGITPVEEGNEDGTGRIWLRPTLLVPDDPTLVQLAEEFAIQWSEIGVEATVEPEDEATYRQRLQDGRFDLAIVELSLGKSADPDVYSFWHQGQFPDGENYGAVDDRRISETLERARRDPFGLNRIEHYEQFQQEFVDRAIAIPLYYPLFTYVVSDRVEGVQLGFIGDASDRFRTLQDWSIAAES
jgi:peptide/nickel transport system substrate-binding protein